jgi:Ca2+-binding EF-hand superfamily protein
VRYEVSPHQQLAIDDLFKQHGGLLDFETFLQIFDLKAGAAFDKSELLSMFKMLSQEYEQNNMIKVTKVEEILSEMELFEIEIAELAVMLKRKEVNGYVNYKEFIEDAF